MESDDSEKENSEDPTTYTLNFSFIWAKLANMALNPDFLVQSLKLMPLNCQLPDYENTSVSSDQVTVKMNQEANRVLDRYNEKDFVAFNSTPDGNCLFNAVSICLFATEEHHHALRLLTLKWMGDNFEALKECRQLPTSDGLVETLQDCAKNRAWSNVLTVFCLAQALRVKINAVHPPENGICDMSYLALPKVLEPISGPPLNEIHVMWWLVSKVEGKFQANHFVPLLVKKQSEVRADTSKDMDEHLKKMLVNLPSKLGGRLDSEKLKEFKDLPSMVAYINMAECVEEVPRCKIYNNQFVVRGYGVRWLQDFADHCGKWKRYKTSFNNSIVGCKQLISFYFRHREFPDYRRTIHALDHEKKALFEYGEPCKNYAALTEYAPTEADVADMILNARTVSQPKTMDSSNPGTLFVYAHDKHEESVALGPCVSVPCVEKARTVHLKVKRDEKGRLATEVIETTPHNYKGLVEMHCRYFYSGCYERYTAHQFIVEGRSAVIYQNLSPNKCFCHNLKGFKTAPTFNPPKLKKFISVKPGQ